MLNRLRALFLLSECTGVDIWPVEHCRMRGIPEEWIDQLADAFESGYNHDRETIYFGERPITQFHGVRDLDLALRLGAYLGVDVARVTATSLGGPATVQAIKEAVEEG